MLLFIGNKEDGGRMVVDFKTLNCLTYELLLQQDETRLRFIVEDTGVGIPREKQKELFERFNQSAFSRNSIGIGLHLTNELVRVQRTGEGASWLHWV